MYSNKLMEGSLMIRNIFEFCVMLGMWAVAYIMLCLAPELNEMIIAWKG